MSQRPRSGARLAFRSRIFEQLDRQFRGGSKLVVVEAQAGQGKTTAAAQYFSRLEVAPLWYSFAPSDRDPVVFLTAFYRLCCRWCSSFRLCLLEDMLEEGVVSAAEYGLVVDMLLSGLRQSGGPHIYLLFDDLHLLDPAGPTAKILRKLVESAPMECRILMLSRQPVLTALGIQPDAVPVGRLESSDLAFSTAEIGELFATVLELPLATADVRRLAAITEGWAMGLLLIASGLETAHEGETLTDLLGGLLKGGQIPDYFRGQLLNTLSETERRSLFKLALLDCIPSELAAKLAPEVDLPALLNRNLFLRKMADDDSNYAFHHLFQDSLRRWADRQLTITERKEVLAAAAEWHRERGDCEIAMNYRLQAQDFVGANDLARQEGLDLFVRNKVVVLQELLRDLPASVLGAYPWLELLWGLSLLSSDPPAALVHLEQARHSFQKLDDGPGELLATAQLMYFHVVVDAKYHRLDPLLDRSAELYNRWGHTLAAHMRMECAHYISSAYTHTARDREKAAAYSAMAMQLARKHNIDNSVFLIAINQGYEGALYGDWDHFRRCFDQVYPLQNSPRVTAFSKLLFHFTQTNLLAVSQDFFNYRYKVGTIQKRLNENLLDGSVYTPYILMHDIDMAIAEGRLQEAEALVARALSDDIAGSMEHFRCQYLQYSACVSALRGDSEAAERHAKESVRLRMKVGHPYHIQVNHLIVGGVYARIGHQEEARYHLTAVMAWSDAKGEESCAPGACFFFAHLELLEDNCKEAIRWLREGLLRLRRNGYSCFYSWDPATVAPLLALAVASDVEADFARSLAAKRLGVGILHNGETIPLLELKLSEESTLVLNDTQLSASELTPIQRQLLLLLATAPSAAMDFDAIQAALWPNVPAKSSRARLDTAVARLRKLLSARLGVEASHYLATERKRLRLHNCQLELQEFVRNARAGLEHSARNEWWQASNAFRVAHACWYGPLANVGPALERRADELNALYINSVMARLKVLDMGGELEEALEVAQVAVRYEPTHPDLVAALYNLWVKEGELTNASRSLRDYESALRRSGYAEADITALRESFWSTSP